ncbi:ATP-binding protein [Microbacterium sp. SA39]|uniref:ATP-binding protein n=1 Tax=Microbacterium sp. SA39 TaxID=1263625 RepID=UPI0005F9B067|nr:LuxR family transcriptional regulator [Microbacterium sp. SA39]
MTNLLGRRAERDVVEALLAEAKVGRSGSLVVRGEAGIGKTALLDHAREHAFTEGFRVERCTGVEAETPFAFAGLHQLCAPLLDRMSALPQPQESALNVAFGLRGGTVPDYFLVGLATLNLLTEAAEAQPLLCLIDDAQWLDHASAQVLAFVTRRITAERIAFLFARREVGDGQIDVFVDLAPELRLTGLGETDALLLLAEEFRTPFDEGIRERILAEAGGNPLALLELPRSFKGWAGGFEPPDALSVPRRIEETFRQRSAGLAEGAQMLLLLAAADPTGDAPLLWRAVENVGLDREDAAPAEASGLVEIRARVQFRHPLVRSAVYRAATPAERRRAHEALAAATDRHVDPDRRAWHRSQSVLGTDEDAALELEHSAARTLARGGAAAAAVFLQRAAELTPAPVDRARRALEAAHARHDAGEFAAALELATMASAGPLDDLQRARVELLRARLAFHRTEGSDAPGMLLDAAETLAPLDASLSRETYLHALDAAMIIGGTAEKRGAAVVARAALAAPAPPGPPLPADDLLDALIVTFTEGYAAGAPAMHRALEAFRDHGFDGEAVGQMGSRRWMWLATRSAAGLFDAEAARILAVRNVRLARELGALTTLPGALAAHTAMLVLGGELTQAEEAAAEGAAITTATGAIPQPFGQLFLAAWCGREDETLRLHATRTQGSAPRTEGAAVATAHYALAVLHNGLGNYPAAVAAAVRARQTDEISNSSITLPELVEAAVRADERAIAETALAELCMRADASGTDWALGLAARSRALVSADEAAEGHYREALERLRASGMNGHLARTHLVFGEWLRREGRRQDAREQLRIAHDSLASMGAEAFAARAARELRATGENPRKRSAHPAGSLTAHELQIARLVATGATSKEVGAQLFLSPRTIEAHLRSIFPKLGITSRRQLKDLLPD